MIQDISGDMFKTVNVPASQDICTEMSVKHSRLLFLRDHRRLLTHKVDPGIDDTEFDVAGLNVDLC